MTFTVLTLDRTAGLIAAATASASLAVGNATISIDPAVGAVASQAWTNLGLRPRLLAGLREGRSPAEVVAEVPGWDEGAEYRQVAALSIDGRAAARTGSLTSDHADGLVGEEHVVVGNLVTGPEVLAAVSAVIAEHERASDPIEALIGAEYEGPRIDRTGARVSAVASLARTVMSAMKAGEQHGGDRRGRQSAGILVAAIGATSSYPPEFAVDLRVDDDSSPLQVLERLVEMRLAMLADTWSGTPFSVRRE